MLSYIEWDETSDPDEAFYLTAEDQTWDEATLKQLRDEYNIFFMSDGEGVVPVMILHPDTIPMVVFGIEDDGMVAFAREYGHFKHCISAAWIPGLIADLAAAKAFCDAKQKEVFELEYEARFSSGDETEKT